MSYVEGPYTKEQFDVVNQRWTSSPGVAVSQVPYGEDFLNWLTRQFPLKNPKVDTPERELWMEVGRQDLIQQLHNLYQKQLRTTKHPLR